MLAMPLAGAGASTQKRKQKTSRGSKFFDFPPKSTLESTVNTLNRCGISRIFCATFCTKLCNTRVKRQDLRGGMVDSKMLLFYCSQLLLSNRTMLKVQNLVLRFFVCSTRVRYVIDAHDMFHSPFSFPSQPSPCGM